MVNGRETKVRSVTGLLASVRSSKQKRATVKSGKFVFTITAKRIKKKKR